MSVNNLSKIINNALDRHDNLHHHDEGESSRTHSNGTSTTRKHRNVAILQDNWTGGSMNHNDPSFLSSSFPRNPPKIFIASDEEDPDPAIFAAWRAEGFNVLGHLPLGLDENPTKTLRDLHRKAGLAPCETYGVVAFGEAASLCLEHWHVLDNNPELKMGLVVAYYPTRIPDPRTRFPSAVRGVVVHLALGEGDVGVVKQSQMVGIQGKRKVVKRRLPERGAGVGGRMEGEGWGGYEIWGYEGAEAGFAEEEADEYDGIAAELAWTRSLGVARGALLGMQNDGRSHREGLVDEFWDAKLEDQDLDDTMAVFSAHTQPSVTYVPTCTGGTGMDELEEFYSEFFLDGNPPTLETTLLSRTVGTDRVVDEVFVTFKHSQEMPWILPGVPATNKRVEIAIVSIVSFKGGKIQHEHVYWDQASVLMQVGLLNPGLIPQAGKKIGVERLPVLGKRASRRVFGSVSGAQDVQANELLYESDDEEHMPQANGRAEKPKTLVERPKALEGRPSQQPSRVMEVVTENEESEKEENGKAGSEKGEIEEEEVEEKEDKGKQVEDVDAMQQEQVEGVFDEFLKNLKADDEAKGEEPVGGMVEGDQLKDGAKKKGNKKKGGKKKNAKKEEEAQGAATNSGFGSVP